MSRHRAQRQRWHRGSLRTTHHDFDSLEAAIAFAGESDPGTVKIYTTDNELVYQNTVTEETYA
jgi:hypothetical protein